MSEIGDLVVAIKAKTDNLPSDPADESLVEAAITAAQVAIVAEVDANEAKIDIIDANVDTVVANTGKVVYGSVSSGGIPKTIMAGSVTGFVEDEKL